MIIISNSVPIKKEIETIQALFEEGMTLFHIRKPEYSAYKIKEFVSNIGQEHSTKLVLHSHHHLALELGINRIHLKESDRYELLSKEHFSFNEKKLHLSTSVHSIVAFNQLALDFEYAFLSPVYKSISKSNYHSQINLFEAVKKRSNFHTKLIGLGGIEALNIQETIKRGFDSVALLGSIWNSDEPIKNFKLCQKIVLSF